MRGVAIASAIGLAFPVFGFDGNQNGMSDVWEQLYPAASEPAVDLDGDGVSNLEESLAWTDPGDSNAVFRLVSSSNSLAWQGERWLRYRPRSATNLVDWVNEGAEVVGRGTNEHFSYSSNEPAAFYRVRALHVLNSDTDALDNREEEQLGTHPRLWDTDGDKVGDDREFAQGSNPLISTDSDGDGLPDDWERWIIAADPEDAFGVLADVVPGGDFDGDGVINSMEFSLGTSPVEPRRTIIFFLSEDQSYHLGCLGTMGLETPNLDALGTGGVIFNRAFSLSSVCSPSKMAMYTGSYPHQNSGYRNVSNYGTNFPLVGDPSNLGLGGVHEDLPTLIEILRDRGYFTAVSHKTHVQPIRKFPYHEGYGQPSTPAVAAGYVVDALNQAGDRPLFFLFGIGAPHLPFRNLPKAQGKWSAAGGLTGDGHVTNVDASSIEVPACYPDIPGVRQDMADYYGSIECVDSIYGAVHSALDTTGELDKTLVLFTGDHGIGLHRAKQSIYGAGMHVPFLFGGAGVTNGVRSSEPVSHLDIVPTLLEFAGLPAMPLMHGKSLWPILSGAATQLSRRETILTAVHRYMDSRAVCDGRYYYIRNIRKIQGASLNPLSNIGNALNADQWQGGSPWFNRAFEATRAAAGTPQVELLRQLVEGDVPDEELYDMDTDLWMTNNLAAEPSMAAVLERLRPELVRWRMLTEDYNESPTELARRTERFSPPTLPGWWTESFDGTSGDLDGNTNWSTRLFGNSGADFQFVGNQLDAPPGPMALATFDPVSAITGQDWGLELETGFYGTGVIAGAVFGFQDVDNYYALQINDLIGLDGGAWAVRFVRRVGGVDTVLWEAATPDRKNTNAAFVHNSMYRLSIDFEAASNTFSCLIIDEAASQTLYAASVSDTAFASGLFGLHTKSSSTSRFDNFSVRLMN